MKYLNNVWLDIKEYVDKNYKVTKKKFLFQERIDAMACAT